MSSAARAELESLLRARKLDVTLTSSAPWADPDRSREIAPTGTAALDIALGGGLARGHLSEVVGPRSSGRTTVLCRMLAAAADRGEAVALIDACDRFDPASAEAAGVDLSKLLWVRDTGDALRALKAMNLVLQAGGFGVVAFDVSDVHAMALRQFPYTTWMRMSRVIEGGQTAAVIVAAERLARSPGGVTIALDLPTDVPRARWSGTSDRARFLRAIDVQTRVVGGT
jgi:recombination protein RecA